MLFAEESILDSQAINPAVPERSCLFVLKACWPRYDGQLEQLPRPDSSSPLHKNSHQHAQPTFTQVPSHVFLF